MTSISKNLYIDRLGEIVHEYNNKYHKTIEIKPVDVNSSTYSDFGVKNNEKILNLRLLIMHEYHIIKIFLETVTFASFLRKFL